MAITAQETKDLICVLAVHLALGEHWERGTVAFTGELLYLRVSARFLPTELVAREGKDLETLLSILPIDIS